MMVLIFRTCVLIRNCGDTVGILNLLWRPADSSAGVHLLFAPRSVYRGCRSVDRLSAAASPICVRPTEERLMSFLPICADAGRFLAPSPEVLVQMVDTCPSVNPDLNKYHLCLRGEHTEGLREKACSSQQKGH